jgi:N-acetylmuramoyl-L-alanine amidase
MRLNRLLLIPVLLLVATPASAGSVENVRIWSENEKTRVVLDLSKPVHHNIFTLRGPDRLVIDLKDGRMASTFKSMPTGVGSVKSIRTGQLANGQLRVVLDLNENVRSRSFIAAPNPQYGDRLVIDLERSGALQTVKRASESYTPGRDIVIAIDAGHGGHDPGSVGRNKTREKDVALAVSKKIAARINAEHGMKAVLVRSGDYYVDHRRRTEIAHNSGADLFISVHADAFKDRRANGATVYALSLKGASDEEARLLAERENKSVQIGGVSLDGKDDVLASVLLDLSQNAALSASLDAGSDIVSELGRVVKVRRKTVQQAGFLVLKSPDMPSILIETAYISNPSEEKLLRSNAHQEKLAKAITAGVRKYFYKNPPPETQIAMDVRRAPSGHVRHKIASGDTLSELAERYDVSPAAIRSANKLNNDNIRIGQVLSIPVFTGS